MYISKLIIKNFRIFEDFEIEFNEKLNVLIGPNNCGKSTILSALSLLFDNNKKRKLSLDDFNKKVSFEKFKEEPPKITITAILTQSKNEKEFAEEIIPIATWLTEIKEKYQAKLTYQFYLPEKHLNNYQESVKNVNNNYEYWNILEKQFINKYVHDIYGGMEDLKNKAKREDLLKFDFQFLSAIRDVEKDLSSGKKTLLKEVLEFFTDYDLKKNENDKDIKNKLQTRSKDFNTQSKILFNMLDSRLKEGKEEILNYIKNTGASADNINPDFIGNITENDLYTHMYLIVDDENGIKLPVELNGLGYNNLLYISLILAKIQKDSSISYLGDNAKFYSILAIEEPEAHLHPNMQYKFLKFLKENQENDVNQIFITSHSPNITAAVSLDNLIILDKTSDIQVYYPYKIFNEENIEFKKYIERFLDVTKSDLFFAKKIIFVEGITEQLLIPLFAERENVELIDWHVSIININGRNFKPFLELFSGEYGIKKEIVCITDKDPQKKKKEGGGWKGCYSYEVEMDENYEYKNLSDDLIEKYEYSDNIKIYRQDESNTFEYDFIINNIVCKELVTDSMKNQKQIKDMMNKYEKNPEDVESIYNCLSNPFKEKIYNNNILSNENKCKHLIATRYIESIDNKGLHAQELLYNLENIEFNTPKYIKEALNGLGKN